MSWRRERDRDRDRERKPAATKPSQIKKSQKNSQPKSHIAQNNHITIKNWLMVCFDNAHSRKQTTIRTTANQTIKYKLYDGFICAWHRHIVYASTYVISSKLYIRICIELKWRIEKLYEWKQTKMRNKKKIAVLISMETKWMLNDTFGQRECKKSGNNTNNKQYILRIRCDCMCAWKKNAFCCT